jgi:predicted MFS family arabinose efflux permease
MMSRITNRNIILALCSASFFIGYFSRLSWGVLASYSSLNPTISDDSIIFSLFFFGYTIVQLPAGLLADRVPPKFIVSCAMFGVALASGLSGIAESIQVEMAASFLTGITAGWVYSPTLKYITLKFPHDALSGAIGYYTLAWPLAITLTGALLPTLALTLGWRWPYYLVAGISLVIGILFLMMGEEAKSEGKLDLSVLREKNVMLLSIGMFILFLGFWTLLLYGYLYLISVGLTGIEAGIVYAMLAVAGFFSSLSSGYIMNRLGTRNALMGSVIMFAGSIVLFSFARSFLTLLLLAGIIGFFRFIANPSLMSAATIVAGREKTGSVAGITNFFGQASGAVAPPLAAVIIQEVGYGPVWIASAGLAIVSAAMFSRIRSMTN